MRSSRIINENGEYVNLVTFDNQSEAYYIGSLKNQSDRWGTSTSDILELVSTRQAVAITVTRDHAYGIYSEFRNMLITQKCSGGVSGNAVAAMNELFTHVVKISDTIDADIWVKRPLRVSAMRYDGTADGFAKAVQFTSLTPIHRIKDRKPDGELTMPTLEDDKIVRPGDYIVRSFEGEFYPVREAVMLKSRKLVKGEYPPYPLPWLQYWDNNQVEVRAHQYTGNNYDAVSRLCEINGWPAPLEHNSLTGVMTLAKGNSPDESYTALPGDVILYESGGAPRVCREDIFRNTYETSPDRI